MFCGNDDSVSMVCEGLVSIRDCGSEGWLLDVMAISERSNARGEFTASDSRRKGNSFYSRRFFVASEVQRDWRKRLAVSIEAGQAVLASAAMVAILRPRSR